MSQSQKIIRRQIRTSYLISLLSITLVLILLGVMGMLVLNARRLSDYVKENIGFSVILKNDQKEADIIFLQKKFDLEPYVRGTEYISKQKAAENLKKDLGEDFVTFLGTNPLPSTIELKLKPEYTTPDSMIHIRNILLKLQPIKDVYYQESLVDFVDQNVRKINIALMAFSLFLLIISIILIDNTVRLTVYAKRFTINTMLLVGATDSFIRKPFMIRSVLQGVISTVLASCVLFAATWWLENQFEGVTFFSDFGLLSIGLLAVGILITLFSTYFAVRKYQYITNDDLYY